MIRKLITNNNGSAIPLILFALTIFVCGALYTLLFIEVAFPTLRHLIPDGTGKTFFMMCIYAIPLFIAIIGVISLLKEGLKRNFIAGGPVQ